MRGRYLYSHLPLDEALKQAKAQPGASVDEWSFRAWWAQAQKRMVERAPLWAAPIERDLPPGCETYMAEIKAIPQAAMIGPRPWAIRVSAYHLRRPPER